jgi:hypothetical protein
MRFSALRTIVQVPLLLLLAAALLQAQTFRGGINGNVTDPSGAVVPNAAVEAVNAGTGISYKAVTSSGGEFEFQDLPLGNYVITVNASGFKPEKVEGVPVSAGTIYTLPVKLSITSAAQTVEVSAAAVALETTTTTETTVIPSQTVQDTPMNGRDFTQLIAIAPGFGGYSAGGFGSVNGSRANQVNWQIDGVDNNDLWHNVPAVNQGGVEGIAGITLPLDSIAEYSQQSDASAESGRNPGGTVNIATKSGTNSIHGSAYYYNRNEFLAANSPFATPNPITNTIEKNELRNQQYGFSVGGPVKKDRAFVFINYEKQQFIIESPATATEPSAAWQTQADSLIASYSLTPSPTSLKVLTTLWPSYALTGGATQNNYSNASPITGYSYNGFGRFDYVINSKNNLSLHYFGGQGNQIAPVGSQLPYYFEEGPIHVYNYSAVLDTTLSAKLTNQVLFGVNYFNQVFYDQDHSFDMASLGWDTGVNANESGAPAITIAGFDGPADATPPSGRNDITGHVTDAANYVIGKHELRFGGEFRRGMVNEFYHRKFRGNFTFDGSQGPWGSSSYNAAGAYTPDNCDTSYGVTTAMPSSAPTAVQALADFLIGCTEKDGIVRGDPEREVYVNTYNLFTQDSWQLSTKLNLNYGLRYDYLGAMHDPYKDLSVFRPNLGGTGFAFQGDQISSLYNPSHADFSPRLGVSYKLHDKTVLHVDAGLYFDQPNLNPFLDNRPPNGGASGAESNPFGASPVGSLGQTSQVITPNAAIFPTSATFNSANSYNLFTIDPDFTSARSTNFGLNVEQQLTSNVVFTLGYVGSEARKLLSIYDINQLPVGGDAAPALVANTTRALYAKYASTIPDMANYGVINEIGSVGDSNYNSLQTTLRVAGWRGVTSQFAYTWGHGLDEMTQYRNANPQNSENFRGEYASMDYDTRNAFTAYVNYDVPKFAGPHWLSSGWQLNTLISIHSGQPYSVLTGTDSSGTNEGEDRPNQTGPVVNGDRKLVKGSGYEQYYTPANFAVPTNAFGTLGRNTLVAPNYNDVDFSVFKNGHLTERVTAQFRVEMFNLFNRVNLAPPDQSLADGSAFGSVTTTIGNWNGAPGIGPGEPFNTQLALKILF